MPRPILFNPPPPPQPAFEDGPMAAYAQSDNPVLRRIAQEVVDWRAWYAALPSSETVSVPVPTGTVDLLDPAEIAKEVERGNAENKAAGE